MDYAVWHWVETRGAFPWELTRWDFWLYERNAAFLLAMLVAVLIYRTLGNFSLVSPVSRSVSLVRSVACGAGGGIAGFLGIGTMVWARGWYSGQMQFIELLIFRAALSFQAKVVLVIFVFAVAISSEVVFRRIVFRQPC